MRKWKGGWAVVLWGGLGGAVFNVLVLGRCHKQMAGLEGRS